MHRWQPPSLELSRSVPVLLSPIGVAGWRGEADAPPFSHNVNDDEQILLHLEVIAVFNDASSSVAQKLVVKVPNVIGLYRNTANGRYYGAKKFRGKRREVSLKTTDRKIAERKLKEWIESLDKVDPEVGRMNLRQLLAKFLAIHQGKSRSTQMVNECLVRCFEKTWQYGLDLEVRDVRPSHLEEWLAMHEGRLKNTSYNRYAGFLKQAFEIAVKDRIIAESPFAKVGTTWKKPQTPIRRIPTPGQFKAIVDSIRSQPFSDHAEDSADFVEFLGFAALGQAEAFALTWKDVDWSRNTLRVRRCKTDVPFFVPIYPRLRPLLERLLAKVGNSHSPGGRVFRIRDAKKALSAACLRLHLPHFSQRNLRQFGIGLLWKASIDKKLIAKWQGHQDGGELILSTYTEVFGSDDQEYERQQLAKLGPVAPSQPSCKAIQSDNIKAPEAIPPLKPACSTHKFSVMDNPFKVGDAVLTVVKKSEVEATVKQVWNREVQVKTADGKLLWRTMHTVRNPGVAFIPKLSQGEQTVVPQSQPVLEAPQPSTEQVQTPVVAPVEVLPVEPVPIQEEAANVLPPVVDGQGITTCGQEEAEDRKRAKGKGKRRAKRKWF